MKKIALIAALLLPFAGSAIAGTLGPSNGAPTQGQITNTECSMVASTNPFTMTASANVGLSYICDSAAAAVQAGSTKGKYVYGGGTSGGSVKQCGTTAVSTTNGYASAPSSATSDGCS